MLNQLQDIPFVLGSQSPRRRELFAGVGLQFRVQIADIDEKLSGTDIAKNTEQLALQKAEAISINDSECLVTADTLVGLNKEILGKPKTEKEAAQMLRSLSNTWHDVFTGVCIKYKNKTYTFHERTLVFINPLSDQDIAHYIQHYNPMDKAGAYGIQDWFGLTQVGEIKGCYYNVMGFPMPRFYNELQKIIV